MSETGRSEAGGAGAGAMGLRERKKQRMYETVSETAIRLFVEKGFDAVSVAEVAAAAEISKPTLFRYFPAKEDLVLYRIADHEDEAARIVREGPSPVEALRRHFLDGIERCDPITGLNDHPAVLAFHTLVYGTPALVARMYAYLERSEAALAEALGAGLDARLAAGQIVAVQRILAQENWRRISAGEPVAEVKRDAVAAAERAFGLLEAGLPSSVGRAPGREAE
ncbi:TetR/AcrR family transcriptional regulator [Streptomyces sp. NBC_01092]|uniref:TetR/AcrR family transcriptional regulator n=1 Tax=Streptomyces sp. NBC_01092 TaxID=2903748 RepID=UPI0038659B3B|nr:TetR/AcrR family transcriptional regulator [Streptomyces sp. NBC_01092]